ncbi:MAG: bifunctional hydroxymethylpyrimidine kinase/phosphomethylpyrimidine kinase [Acidimicrobiia bacterium]
MALTIAGSDSGGGAGIQADLRTFAALGVFGTTAITAITAQNSAEVRQVVPLDAALVVAQATTVLDDFPVAAVKTGMLATGAIIDAVAALATAGRLRNLVVDPVLVSSTGARLGGPDAVERYRSQLLAHAQVVTPNRSEAEALLGTKIGSWAEQRDALRALAELGPRVVVITGGQPPDNGTAAQRGDAVDVVYDAATGDERELRAPWVPTANTHGSGCSFASAVAARLAHGDDLHDALDKAKAFVARAIASGAGWALGSGHGPLDHFGWDDDLEHFDERERS